MLETILNQGLKDKISIYIPSTIDVDKEIDTSEYVDKCAVLLSQMFGGATSQQVKGYWMSETRGLVKEDITIVYAFANEVTKEDGDKIFDFIYTMKEELSQEAISIEMNGRLTFV